MSDSAFYHDAVEWGLANGITVGCNGGTAFCGEDDVTRGENMTFAHRYDTNVVQPALEAIQGDLDAAESDIASLGPMYWAVIDDDGSIISRSTGVNSDTAQTRRLTAGRYEVDFTEVNDVGACHAMVSRSESSTNNVVSTGQIFTEQAAGDTSSLFIGTANSSGTATDSPFTVQLWCSPAALPPIVALGE